MTEQSVRHAAASLLKHYSFELGGYSTEQLVQHWLDHHPGIWLRMAIIEALYQGRYKAVSVDQILTMWHRRAQPVCHYNHEFERMICNRFPRNLLDDTEEQGSILLAELGGLEWSGGPNSAQLGSDALPSGLKTAEQQGNRSAVVSSQAEQAIAPDADRAAIANAAQIHPPMITTFVPAPVSQPNSIKELVSRDDATRKPIHQFVPSGETPEFYAKLRASAPSPNELFDTADSVSSFN